jgi:16S rRNA (cytosine1402-N4)-methyltransferase
LRSSESDAAARHEPVLVAEVLELLAVRPGGLYVDGTLGPGGHARRILTRSAPGGRLLGVDRDADALKLAREQLAEFGDRAELLQGDYRQLPELLMRRDARPDGILLDLGIGSHQLDSAERGFSFREDGPLDMRIDRSAGEPAAALVNRLSAVELADVIYRFGEERASRRIARAIVEERRRQPIRTTAELARVVRRAAPRGRPGHDAATRTFQALRIRVNGELEGLEQTVAALAEALAPGGRLAVIAFHSLEDRPVKHALRRLARDGYRLLTRKAIQASPEERSRNRRSRSARLRGLERPLEEAA